MGRTVAELCDVLTLAELADWLAYFAASREPEAIDLTNAGPDEIRRAFNIKGRR
jgi:hypothetical protein